MWIVSKHRRGRLLVIPKLARMVSVSCLFAFVCCTSCKHSTNMFFTYGQLCVLDDGKENEYDV